MRLAFYNFKLRRDLDKIKFVHWGQFVFLFYALYQEYKLGVLGVVSLLTYSVILTGFYNLYFKTAQKLFYTFWTFSFIAFLYQGFSFLLFFFFYDFASLNYLYLMSLVFLFTEIYFLSSPIYFPRVSWWEYDFRYRDDIKIKVLSGDKKLTGRLTDIRRGAGCLVLFDQLKVGESINIEAKDKYRKIFLRGEIMSKREYSIGRGTTYGVKFHFEEDDLKKQFQEFCLYWKEERRTKILRKFSKIKSNEI